MAPIAFVAIGFVMGCSDDESPMQEDASADRGDDPVDDTGDSNADTFGMGETSNGNQSTGAATTLEPDPDTTFGGQTETGDDPETETTSAGFIYGNPDTGGLEPFDCDIWAQDCPEGEKCSAWANDGGGAWNATRCVPVDDDPDQVGEACNVEGSGCRASTPAPSVRCAGTSIPRRTSASAEPCARAAKTIRAASPRERSA